MTKEIKQNQQNPIIRLKEEQTPNAGIFYNMTMSEKTTLTRLSLLAAGVLALAGVLARFWGLSKGLTFDELYSMGSSSPDFSLPFIWREILLKDVNAPLYNMLLWFWNHLFPAQNEWSLRLPSLLCGLLMLWAGWKGFPKRLPALTKKIYILILCCNGFLIYYSQEARTYALLLLLAQGLLFAAVSFAVRFQENRPVRRWEWAAYFIGGLITCYLHYFGAAFFFALSACLFGYALYYQRCDKTVFFGGAAVFLAFCPWLWLTAHNGLDQAAQTWWIPYKWSVWTRGMAVMLFNSPWTAAAALALCVVAVRVQVKREGGRSFFRPEIFLPLGATAIVLAFVWAAGFRVNLLLPRYFLVLVPALFLLFCQWLSLLIRRDAYLIVLVPLLLLGLMYPAFFDSLLSPARGLNPLQKSAAYTVKESDEPQLAYYLHEIDYPAPARDKLLHYYPDRAGLQTPLVPLTQELLNERFKTREATRVWVPLCGPKRLAALEKDFDVYTVEPDYRYCFITLMPKSRFDNPPPASNPEAE